MKHPGQAGLYPGQRATFNSPYPVVHSNSGSHAQSGSSSSASSAHWLQPAPSSNKGTEAQMYNAQAQRSMAPYMSDMTPRTIEKRAPTACHECRKKKQRCDNCWPCYACQQKDVPCVYPEQAAPRVVEKDPVDECLAIMNNVDRCTQQISDSCDTIAGSIRYLERTTNQSNRNN